MSLLNIIKNIKNINSKKYMHFDEAINHLNNIHNNKKFSREVIQDMNYIINHAPESLMDKKTKGITTEYKQKKIHNTLVETLAQHYTIHDSIEDINKWINTDYPKIKHKNVNEFIHQINYKFYGYILGASGIGKGIYNIIENGTSEIAYITAITSGLIIVASDGLRIKEKNIKIGMVKNYYDTASEYCKTETKADNSIRRLNRNLYSYRDNLNYLSTQIRLTKNVEDKLNDLIIDLTEFKKNLKKIDSTITKEKVSISGYYDLKIPKFFWQNLVNQDYFYKIENNNKKKAILELKYIDAS